MDNTTLETLPPELILLIAKRLDIDDLWNLSHSCRRFFFITRKLARPTLALRYPSLNSTFAEEHQSKLGQILLAHKATYFKCKLEFPETGNCGVYSAKKLWLRSMIVHKLPHLAIRVASEMEPEEAQSPMNGITIDRLALQLGQDTVAEFIKNTRPQQQKVTFQFRVEENGSALHESRAAVSVRKGKFGRGG